MKIFVFFITDRALWIERESNRGRFWKIQNRKSHQTLGTGSAGQDRGNSEAEGWGWRGTAFIKRKLNVGVKWINMFPCQNF